ncbi:unnamed protein product [Closterium sp. Yama58-4]|nr:unnamed protein product [Closterium sp. Yama58-4]
MGSTLWASITLVTTLPPAASASRSTGAHKPWPDTARSPPLSPTARQFVAPQEEVPVEKRLAICDEAVTQPLHLPPDVLRRGVDLRLEKQYRHRIAQPFSRTAHCPTESVLNSFPGGEAPDRLLHLLFRPCCAESIPVRLIQLTPVLNRPRLRGLRLRPDKKPDGDSPASSSISPDMICNRSLLLHHPPPFTISRDKPWVCCSDRIFITAETNRLPPRTNDLSDHLEKNVNSFRIGWRLRKASCRSHREQICRSLRFSAVVPSFEDLSNSGSATILRKPNTATPPALCDGGTTARASGLTFVEKLWSAGIQVSTQYGRQLARTGSLAPSRTSAEHTPIPLAQRRWTSRRSSNGPSTFSTSDPEASFLRPAVTITGGSGTLAPSLLVSLSAVFLLPLLRFPFTIVRG